MEGVPSGRVSKILALKGLKIDSAVVDICLFMHKSENKYSVAKRYYSKWSNSMKSLYNNLGNFFVEVEMFEFVYCNIPLKTCTFYSKTKGDFILCLSYNIWICEQFVHIFLCALP